MVKKAKRSAEKVELIKVSAARLEEFLEGRVIFNKSIDSNGVTVFRGILGGYKGQYDNFRFKILVSSWCVVSYAYLPFMVKQDKRNLVAELITRINWCVKVGHFDLNFKTGEVRFKSEWPMIALDEASKDPESGISKRIVYQPSKMVHDWAEVIDLVTQRQCNVEKLFARTLEKLVK